MPLIGTWAPTPRRQFSQLLPLYVQSLIPAQRPLCQGQLTFDPFRQLEMDPLLQCSEKESVFLAAHLQPRSSVQQWRRNVSHRRNMVSRSLRSFNIMFLRWFEKRAHCLFEKTGDCFFAYEGERGTKNQRYSAAGVAALVVPPFVSAAARRSFMR
jgi:hypothetical protein